MALGACGRVLSWCFVARAFKTSIVWKAAEESKPVVGSSRNNIPGSVKTSAATLILRFSPPEMLSCMIVPIFLSTMVDSPKSSIFSSIVLGSSRPSARRWANLSVSLAVRLPIRASSCPTYAEVLRIRLSSATRPLI